MTSALGNCSPLMVPTWSRTAAGPAGRLPALREPGARSRRLDNCSRFTVPT